MADIDPKTCVAISICPDCGNSLRMNVSKSGVVMGSCATADENGVKCYAQHRHSKVRSRELIEAFIANGSEPIDMRDVMRNLYVEMDRQKAAKMKATNHGKDAKDDATQTPDAAAIAGTGSARPRDHGNIYDLYE